MRKKAVTAITPSIYAAERVLEIAALTVPQAESGVSRPSTGVHRASATGLRYDIFGSERYALSVDNRAWRELAQFAPYDVVEIIFNSETYGGGGIFGQAGARQARQGPKAEHGAEPGPGQQARQIAPVAAQGGHGQEGKPDAGQGGMRHGIRHQRAAAQRGEGPDAACGKAQKRRAQRDKGGVIARLQQECGDQQVRHGRDGCIRRGSRSAIGCHRFLRPARGGRWWPPGLRQPLSRR